MLQLLVGAAYPSSRRSASFPGNSELVAGRQTPGVLAAILARPV